MKFLIIVFAALALVGMGLIATGDQASTRVIGAVLAVLGVAGAFSAAIDLRKKGASSRRD